MGNKQNKLNYRDKKRRKTINVAPNFETEFNKKMKIEQDLDEGIDKIEIKEIERDDWVILDKEKIPQIIDFYKKLNIFNSILLMLNNNIFIIESFDKNEMKNVINNWKENKADNNLTSILYYTNLYLWNHLDKMISENELCEKFKKYIELYSKERYNGDNDFYYDIKNIGKIFEHICRRINAEMSKENNKENNQKDKGQNNASSITNEEISKNYNSKISDHFMGHYSIFKKCLNCLYCQKKKNESIIFCYLDFNYDYLNDDKKNISKIGNNIINKDINFESQNKNNIIEINNNNNNNSSQIFQNNMNFGGNYSSNNNNNMMVNFSAINFNRMPYLDNYKYNTNNPQLMMSYNMNNMNPNQNNIYNNYNINANQIPFNMNQFVNYNFNNNFMNKSQNQIGGLNLNLNQPKNTFNNDNEKINKEEKKDIQNKVKNPIKISDYFSKLLSIYNKYKESLCISCHQKTNHIQYDTYQLPNVLTINLSGNENNVFILENELDLKEIAKTCNKLNKKYALISVLCKVNNKKEWIIYILNPYNGTWYKYSDGKNEKVEIMDLKNLIPFLAIYQNKTTIDNYSEIKIDNINKGKIEVDNQEMIEIQLNYSDGVIDKFFYDKNKTIENLIQEKIPKEYQNKAILLINALFMKKEQKISDITSNGKCLSFSVQIMP